MIQSCENCKFWKRRPDSEFNGLCRVAPPRPFGDAYSIWPATSQGDWCGEWISKDPPPAVENAPAATKERPVLAVLLEDHQIHTLRGNGLIVPRGNIGYVWKTETEKNHVLFSTFPNRGNLEFMIAISKIQLIDKSDPRATDEAIDYLEQHYNEPAADPREFGRLLRAFRQEIGVSLAPIADFLEMGIGVLSSIERGTSPPLNTDQIARLLDEYHATSQAPDWIEAAERSLYAMTHPSS